MACVTRRALTVLALAVLLPLAACGGDDGPTAAGTPTPVATSTGTPPGSACDYLLDGQVSDLLGSEVEGVAQGGALCEWGELSLLIADATPAEFDEERSINSADAEVPPPSLGVGDDSYLILGEPGGTGSAGALVGGRKAVLALPGDLPQDLQRALLTTFLTTVAAQL